MSQPKVLYLGCCPACGFPQGVTANVRDTDPWLDALLTVKKVTFDEWHERYQSQLLDHADDCATRFQPARRPDE